jgi:hypothetical protein
VTSGRAENELSIASSPNGLVNPVAVTKISTVPPDDARLRLSLINTVGGSASALSLTLPVIEEKPAVVVELKETEPLPLATGGPPLIETVIKSAFAAAAERAASATPDNIATNRIGIAAAVDEDLRMIPSIFRAILVRIP